MDIPGAEPELQGFSGPAWQKWHYNSSVQILVKGKGHGSVDLLGTVSKKKVMEFSIKLAGGSSMTQVDFKIHFR